MEKWGNLPSLLSSMLTSAIRVWILLLRILSVLLAGFRLWSWLHNMAIILTTGKLGYGMSYAKVSHAKDINDHFVSVFFVRIVQKDIDQLLAQDLRLGFPCKIYQLLRRQTLCVHFLIC